MKYTSKQQLEAVQEAVGAYEDSLYGGRRWAFEVEDGNIEAHVQRKIAPAREVIEILKTVVAAEEAVKALGIRSTELL